MLRDFGSHHLIPSHHHPIIVPSFQLSRIAPIPSQREAYFIPVITPITTAYPILINSHLPYPTWNRLLPNLMLQYIAQGLIGIGPTLPHTGDCCHWRVGTAAGIGSTKVPAVCNRVDVDLPFGGKLACHNIYRTSIRPLGFARHDIHRRHRAGQGFEYMQC